MSTASNDRGVWPWRKGSSPSTDPEQLLKSLQANMASLSKNTELGVSLSERIQDTIEQTMETNAEFRDTTIEDLNKLSSTISDMTQTVFKMSKAQEVRDYINGAGKYTLNKLANEISQLSRAIEENIAYGRRLASQEADWALLEERLQAEHAAVGEIVVQLAAEHVSGYYESARQRHVKRRRWLFFLLILTISSSVFGLIQRPDLLLPTLPSTNGELNE